MSCDKQCQDKSYMEKTKETLGNAADTVKEKATDLKVNLKLDQIKIKLFGFSEQSGR